MGAQYNMVNVVYMISLVLFITSCYWNVNSADTSQNNGALTVVSNEDELADGVVETEEEPLSSEVFYPNKEWQVVKTGQAIPKGLHVRINLETGLKEAKLMDGDDGLKYWKEGDKQGMVNTDKKEFTTQELKEALKNFKSEQEDVQDEEVKREAVKKKFRSYEELKKDMQMINVDVKTDVEILSELFEQYTKKGTPVETKLELLDEFEFLVHQIDNAVNFADIGGVVEMMKALNDSENEAIRSGAAFVLGAATQSNPKVQIKVLEAGVLQQLIRMLNTERSIKLQNRVLYALSSTIRHFPFAQEKFFQLGGLDTLLSLFHVAGAEKLQVKVVSLMNDLLNEQHLSEKHLDETSSVEVEKVKQYKKVPILDTLLENGWCKILPPLLEMTDHDSREKVINAMNLMLKSCSNEFKASIKWLKNLEREYRHLSDNDEDGDEYFETMANKAQTVIDRVSNKYRQEL